MFARLTSEAGVVLPVKCGVETVAILCVRNASRWCHMVLMSVKGRSACFKCPRNETNKQRGVGLISKGSHSVLNHTISRRQKILAAHGVSDHFFDIVQEIDEEAAQTNDESREPLQGESGRGGDEMVMKASDEILEDHLPPLVLSQAVSDLSENGVDSGGRG